MFTYTNDSDCDHRHVWTHCLFHSRPNRLYGLTVPTIITIATIIAMILCVVLTRA
jgi:hypothetical protein